MPEMPGNGNYYGADHPDASVEDRAIWALKAIAFEQRTANLIQYAVHNSTALAEGIDVDIRERLGMDPLTVDAPADQRCGKPLMDGRNEIRCWLKAHHEEACR